jgi:type IV/VI secretion system ImpK/VasF family protein
VKINELVRPAFLFAAALRRKIRRGVVLDYGEVKRSALSLLNRLEAEASTQALTDRWERAKIPIVYLLDEIAIMERWPGADFWNDQSLEIEYLGHTEKMRGVWFFDREYKDAVERGDTEMIEILYVCLCLGFEGKLRGQTAQLKNHIDNLHARLPLPLRDEHHKRLLPKAYSVDLTANDPRLPITITSVLAIFFGIIITYFVVNHVLYTTFVGDLRHLAESLT